MPDPSPQDTWHNELATQAVRAHNAYLEQTRELRIELRDWRHLMACLVLAQGGQLRLPEKAVRAYRPQDLQLEMREDLENRQLVFTVTDLTKRQQP